MKCWKEERMEAQGSDFKIIKNTPSFSIDKSDLIENNPVEKDRLERMYQIKAAELNKKEDVLERVKEVLGK